MNEIIDIDVIRPLKANNKHERETRKIRRYKRLKKEKVKSYGGREGKGTYDEEARTIARYGGAAALIGIIVYVAGAMGYIAIMALVIYEIIRGLTE